MLTCYCRKINFLLVDGLDGSSWFIFRGRFLTFLWHKNVHSMYYLMGKYRYNNGELSTHYRAIVEHAWVFQRHSLYNELTIPDQSKWWWFCWWYRFIQQNSLNNVTSECSDHMFHVYTSEHGGICPANIFKFRAPVLPLGSSAPEINEEKVSQEEDWLKPLNFKMLIHQRLVEMIGLGTSFAFQATKLFNVTDYWF